MELALSKFGHGCLNANLQSQLLMKSCLFSDKLDSTAWVIFNVYFNSILLREILFNSIPSHLNLILN